MQFVGNNMYKLKETTKWSVKVSNGTYIFEKKFKGNTGKAIGFIPYNASVPTMFKKPTTIEMKGRTFDEVI